MNVNNPIECVKMYKRIAKQISKQLVRNYLWEISLHKTSVVKVVQWSVDIMSGS